MKLYIKLAAAAAAAVICLLLHDPLKCCAVLILYVTGLLVYDVISEYRMKRDLDRLIEYITKVQDDLSLAAPECSSEGRLGILQSEIYKVVALLREQYSGEKKQKEYLSDMLSDISHQIKTPLTAIQLMTELLEKPELDAEKRLEYAKNIDKQLARITWLIRNLLALSQLEAGMLKLKRDPLPVRELIGDINGSLAIMAELKGVELVSDIPDITLEGDRHWLCEALMNIVKNCVEHTDEGGYVRVRALKNNICTEFVIEDNGCGISEKDLPHIFERFYKAENASVQSVGIGLALAKQIIVGHGGVIDVNSEKNKGTCFRIKIYSM